MQLDETTRTTWDARHYGAVGDGTTDDAAAIQLAVDRCHAAGGGQVLLPAGRYLSGTISLRSNVQLHLSAGAQLLAGGRLLAGPVDADGAPLITARGLDNVSITGAGVIDGGAASGPMIVLDGCRRVRVHEVTLLHSPHGTLALVGCDDAEIRGVTLTNPAEARTGDGIALIGSRDVMISDCRIRAGAGGLVLRGADRDGADHETVSEGVIVGRCTFAAAEQGVRIVGGPGVLRNCLFADLVIKDCGVGVSITSDGAGEARIERLRFSNLIIDGDTPIAVDTSAASVRDLAFAGMTITASSAATLVGADGAPLQRVRLSNVDWTVRSVDDGVAGDGPAPEAALRGRHLVDLIVDSVTVRRDGVISNGGHGLFDFEHTQRTLIHGLREEVSVLPANHAGE